MLYSRKMNENKNYFIIMNTYIHVGLFIDLQVLFEFEENMEREYGIPIIQLCHNLNATYNVNVCKVCSM